MGDASPATIAVVDDDSRILESLGELLESRGYIVRLYGSAQSLLDGGGLETGDCLITDLGMPAMDGFELCRRLRCANPDLAVIFMTARNGLHDQERAARVGHHGFFEKPFDATAMLAAVKKAVSAAT
ncbi:response regulator [Rhizobium laguerreae]|uniref:response regulator transcription factor n=1 Tax=Rhizobium laguerreae TaxID=1076926 RepID=UPI001C92B3F3|nr:response regulator [Rhizobium laguerreae]MBY3537566.1 response regulator [Rhizobium laguerreae]